MLANRLQVGVLRAARELCYDDAGQARKQVTKPQKSEQLHVRKHGERKGNTANPFCQRRFDAACLPSVRRSHALWG